MKKVKVIYARGDEKVKVMYTRRGKGDEKVKIMYPRGDKKG